MSDPAKVMQLPPTVEDCQLAIEHSLSLLSASYDRLCCAGYTLTHPHCNRRPRLTGAREAVLAIREIENRLPLLADEVTTLLRRIDPCSEMLPESLP